MTPGMTISVPFHMKAARKGQLVLERGTAPEPVEVVGRTPHLSKLMALAIRMERLLMEGHIRDMAELARVGHVSRARVTQILNLRFLAPDIQEEILHLPSTEIGRDPVKEWQIRPIAATLDWKKQWRMWEELKARTLREGSTT